MSVQFIGLVDKGLERKMKEWKADEELPQSFVGLIQEAVKNNCFQRKAVFIQVACEWDINPSILSRWLAGLGPLNEEDILKLAKAIGPAVYPALGRVRP